MANSYLGSKLEPRQKEQKQSDRGADSGHPSCPLLPFRQINITLLLLGKVVNTPTHNTIS